MELLSGIQIELHICEMRRWHAFPALPEKWKAGKSDVASPISGTPLYHRRHNRLNRGF